jgi:hypothetical protein
MRQSSEFVINKVKDELIFSFLEKYHEQVLLEAGSLMQLLMLFEKEWLFSLEFLA